MSTPIKDFIDSYLRVPGGAVRAHMPGHKGDCGYERDITEIRGADYLFDPRSVIAKSEAEASRLFGTAATFYSTEGSSLCIRAMLYLAALRNSGKKTHTVLAFRNAHKSFIAAAALCGYDVEWIYGEGSLLESRFDLTAAEERLKTLPEAPDCLYVTSPDYLGARQDIAALASLARRYGTLLIVDNAHGAYLKFLPRDIHPISLGADMCCDSAHKTLPALTGAAYLHMGGRIGADIIGAAPRAMELFGSTSPSWPVLESMDLVNEFLERDAGSVANTVNRVNALKAGLENAGWTVAVSDPLRVTVKTKPYGYTGDEVADILEASGVYVEFADRDNLVMMLAPFNPPADFDRILKAMSGIAPRTPVKEGPPVMPVPAAALKPREALFKGSEAVPAELSAGRVFASCALSCPPAVPPLAAGEIIPEGALKVFEYYGISTVNVIKE